MIRDTSQAAYHQHAASGALLSQRQFILQFLKDSGPRTRGQIAEATGIPINAVCGRVNELVGQELVKDTRRVKTAFGRQAYLVEVM